MVIAMGHTWTAYWPWWITLGWMVGYELFALATHRPTLSRMVWTATSHWPALATVSLAIIGLVAAHFWVPVLRPVIWGVPAILIGVGIYWWRRR